jgi:hypothetical protein
VNKDNTPIVAPKRDPRLGKDDDNQFDDGSATPAKPAGGGGGGGNLGVPQGNKGGGGGNLGVGEGAGKAGGGKPAAGDEKKPTEAAQINFVADWCVIRFVDLTLSDETKPVGGRTFEYRVRAVMKNPNFGDKNVAVPEYAKIPELAGLWSQPVRVAFPDGHALFADERQRSSPKASDSGDLEKVPVQVHKWVGFFDPQSDGVKEQKRMGEWWVDRILAVRGEYIGRVPTDRKHGESRLIVWVPYVPEDNDAAKMGSETIDTFRTPSLMTSALLVDFEGGLRHPSTTFKRIGPGGTVSNKNEYEDVPAELLIAEPDGRLVARTLLKDKEEDVRKKRFDRFAKWFKEVDDKEKAKKPEEEKKDDKDKKKDKDKPAG